MDISLLDNQSYDVLIIAKNTLHYKEILFITTILNTDLTEQRPGHHLTMG